MENYQAAAQLAMIEKVTDGMVRSVRVPGHETINVVYLRRLPGNTIEAECRRRTEVGDTFCPAYEHGLVCYHSQAAVVVAAKAQGHRIVGWARTRAKATALLNLRQFHGCRIGHLVPRGSSRAKYFLWR